MAISDEPQPVRNSSILNQTSVLRRRPSATSVNGLFDSSATVDGESSGEELVKDSSSDESVSGDQNIAANTEQNRVNDISTIKFAYRPSVPAHRRIKESPLSSDNIFRQNGRVWVSVSIAQLLGRDITLYMQGGTDVRTQNFPSHAGLFNLCIVVLVAVNSRLIIENLMKYGWLIKTGFWFSSKSLRDWPLFMCCLSLAIFPLAAFVVEKLAQQKRISEPIVVLLHIIITTTAILYPIFVILRSDSAFVSGVTLMLLACIVWLKLISYAHTNYDLRALTNSIEKGEVLPNNMDYPYDVSFKSMTYFMVAPTLCYQPRYPRTPFIRKGWVFRQLVKLIIFTGVMGFIIEQYINPIVQNSQHPFKGDLLYAIERVLKLSVPNLYVWLCMFYCFFHLWLNILAELLRFGDREFYKDWWNARTVEEPVHKWMIRHLYFPCLRSGIPKGAAVLIAFLVSALFHELCIAVPCHIFKLWAFSGIMFQVPSHHTSNLIRGTIRHYMRTHLLVEI
ncbi:diacylglycerol o-acyltransferase 1-like protein [Trifolium pratense]|uniref:O-acyltransferase n=1 Tax=Trifolium pratense TaxID=57577 RepID=A0A2K3NRE4_TRIPR|nr:diacylglycerol o-acyltransferase 1-like protein [Trifolium pratense]